MGEPVTHEDIYQLLRAGETFFVLAEAVTQVQKTGFFEKPVFWILFFG
ncbi:MAG: hypothetical protein IM550_17165 [Microcystis sp. M54BS1]|jgi:hypothetical protein|nr:MULTISPECIES: hypothetical protein [unclassified Microcystis]MCA2508215.1 hypothetical protein [Microcystis sp. M62BS1]MCA2523147.1 hypothetical protein [Microcystis sp. M63BS1]MCA2540877.1 hypothetical protein [Microcystis sp. M54BS1]MCA2550062.1 hypothetical protein [Microcystis sp. M53BS1]MCA2565305.1 hypothetical protein [Microcystis sp. M44BS1]MCA2595406.1 hypothetical protein [Microcystis sp. M38BS1]MCA2608638.1 hypothetical protein [Microcystis sp. M27BS1]NCS29910.1 hypothetical p